MYQFIAKIQNMKVCVDRETLVEVDLTPYGADILGGDTEEVFAWKVAVNKAFALLKDAESLTSISLLSC